MSEQKTKRHVFPDGIYRLKVLSNTLTKNDKQTYVVLNCEVIGLKKLEDRRARGEDFKTGQKRTVNLYTTPAAIDKTKSFLQYAQFPAGRSVAALLKDHPDHYSLEGVEFDASTKVNQRGYDEFSPMPNQGFGNGNAAWMDKLAQPSLSDTAKLDSLFGISSAPTPAPAAAPSPAQQAQPQAASRTRARW